MIGLSVLEVRRLLCRLLLSEVQPAEFSLFWSVWRRRHQARAARCHARRRDARLNPQLRL